LPSSPVTATPSLSYKMSVSRAQSVSQNIRTVL
jgi:hypothetical protein